MPQVFDFVDVRLPGYVRELAPREGLEDLSHALRTLGQSIAKVCLPSNCTSLGSAEHIIGSAFEDILFPAGAVHHVIASLQANSPVIQNRFHDLHGCASGSD